MTDDNTLLRSVKQLIRLVWILIFCVLGSAYLWVGDALGWFSIKKRTDTFIASVAKPASADTRMTVWQAPDTAEIPNTPEGELIRYGRELIAHTSVYLGPQGKVKAISNGMNCQNCHLKAGTLPYAYNFGSTASKYPIFRARSGMLENFEKRINDCMERSMNGQPLEEDSREMKAMISYLKWVGKDVEKDETLPGLGMLDLKPLSRAADPAKGRLVFETYCVRCHGQHGEGLMTENGLEYTYPPLYGDYSYNTGAGLHRLSRFAVFVKFNMPFGVTYENPFLTDEEAWDVAAYVNSMPRPTKVFPLDWPDIARKPFDHPFGPYADAFSEEQHKYGPFGPIIGVYQ